MQRRRKAVIFTDTVHGSMVANFNNWLKYAGENEFEIISITPLSENKILVLYTFIEEGEI